MKKKFESTLSVTTKWTDKNQQTENNVMIINNQKIVFRSTFRVQTKEMLDELFSMKRRTCRVFKEKYLKDLNLAILKIKREQNNFKLLNFDFELFKESEENKILIIRR
jgi:aromatic ring-opening dioxygenase LigB subunit